MIVLLSLPIWTPFLFLAYFCGAKTYRLKDLFSLVTIEALALAIATWISSDIFFTGKRFGTTALPLSIGIAVLMSVQMAWIWFPLCMISFAYGRQKVGKAFWIIFIAIKLNLMVIGTGLISSPHILPF
jgi:hypothetical protein